MLALLFTNGVFFSYALYLFLEKKAGVYKSKVFWMMIVGLAISLYLTWLSFPVNVPLERTLLP